MPSPTLGQARVSAVEATRPSCCSPAKAGSRAAQRFLCSYLMVETTAAHCALRQQKSALANRPSPDQPITRSANHHKQQTTNNKQQTTNNLLAFNHYSTYSPTLLSNNQAIVLVRYSNCRSKSPVMIPNLS
jgi:hypothetical protein